MYGRNWLNGEPVTQGAILAGGNYINALPASVKQIKPYENALK
ncbi:hypothetical protein [Spirosoma flavum]|uniref:Uncharacterized protein n=1 Tax=Spirosoma flavum TaxID=2048557 RepID=A0ABW6AMK4_9BACT